jgi:hypothetical protein
MSLAMFITTGLNGSATGEAGGGGDTPPPPTTYHDFMNRFVNATLPSNYLATYPSGFNEHTWFDAADGTNDIELFWDARTSIKYVRFHDWSELPTKISSALEVTIKSSWTQGYVGGMKVSGTYYLYLHDAVGSGRMSVISGNSISALQTATPTVLISDGSAVDWNPKPNPIDGGYITCGFTSGGKAAIWTATTPAGTWTLKGLVFPVGSVDENPPYATNQADGEIIFSGGKAYATFDAFHSSRQGTPRSSHNVIVELDPANNYAAKGRPIEFIHQFDRTWQDSLPANPYAFCYNACYGVVNGQEYVTYVASSGDVSSPNIGWIAVMPLAVSDEAATRSIYTIARAEGGNNYDADSNRLQFVWGDLTNDSTNGIKATNGGLYNFMNASYLDEYDLSCSFKVFALPTSEDGLVFILGNKGAMSIALVVTTAGRLKIVFKDDAATTTVDTGQDIVLNTLTSITMTGRRPSDGFFKHHTFNGTEVRVSGGNFYAMDTYSLLNDQTDVVAAGRQLNGAIMELNVIGKLYPLNPLL